MAKARKQALPDALSRDMWRTHIDNANHPGPGTPTLEARVRKIEEETAIRDLLVKYAYSYDSNNVPSVMTVFADDCVLVNPRGTYVGAEAIRACYTHLISTRRYSFHHVTNMTIRLADDMAEAVATTYWTDKHVGASGSIDGSDGTYADRLKKTAAGWKIVERRITANIFYVMTPYPDAWSPIPPPTRPEGTRQWFGAKHMR